MEVQPYVLVELEDLSPLSSPVKSSQRIKYTCFDASQRFIVLGATSGGIYIFQRKPCIFLQLIPNTEGAVTQVSVSPNESMFAFSTVKGFVFLVDHNVGQDGSGGVRKVQVSSDHRGAQITAFQWHLRTSDLYIGDDKGKISVVSVSFFMAKTIFQAPSFTLMELDSKIVQMDLHGNLLLVSTLTRSFICDTAQEQYRKIGSKPRNGTFGACFQEVDRSSSPVSDENVCADGPADINPNMYNSEAMNVRIFCARPGARLWEVGIGGEVVSTHKFAEVLSVPPVPILYVNSEPEQLEKSVVPGFTKVFPIGERFIFSYEQHSVYIMDPENACVILWSRLHQETTDVRVIGNIAYLWSGSLMALTLLTVEECLQSLFSAGRFKVCTDLCLCHLQYLMEHAQHILPLADLGKHIPAIPEEMIPLIEEVSRLAKKLEGRGQPHINMFRRLESGMHVNVGHESNGRKSMRDIHGGVAAMRSRSASPGFHQRKHALVKRDALSEDKEACSLASDGPSASLPDLSEGAVDSNGTEKPGSVSDSRNGLVIEEKEAKPVAESIQSQAKSIGTISQKLVEGTMTIREKWQELEGLVRAFSRDSPVEVSQADKCDEQDCDDEENEASDEGVYVYEDDIITSARDHLLKRSMSSSVMNKLPEAKPFHPVLDLENLFEKIKKIASDGYELSLLHSLFDSIFEAFLSYSSEKNKESGSMKNGKDAMGEVTVSVEEPKAENFLFPFRYYFTESMIAIILKCIEVLLSSDNSSAWLEEKFSSSLIIKADAHPALRNACSQQEFIDDKYCCALLDPFLDIIDPLRILSSLGNCSSPCRFLTWCKVIELVISKPWERLTKPPNGSTESGHLSNIPATFPFLLTEFDRVRESNCSMLLKDAPQILVKEGVSLRHSLYIIYWLCADNKNEDWCSALLSTFLLSEVDITQDRISHSCVIDALNKLNSRASPRPLCSCGYPCPGIATSCAHRYASVVVRLAKKSWQAGHLEDSLKLCWESGLWRWFVWFLHSGFLKRDELGKTVICDVLSPLSWDESRGQWEWGILSLLATLGDSWCLEEWLEEMDEVAWRNFVDLRKEVVKGNCLGCIARGLSSSNSDVAKSDPSTITWTEIGILMMENLGPECACSILMDSCSSDSDVLLDASFYRLCILSTIVSSVAKDKLAVKTVVRKLLGQETRDVCSPQVSQLVEECLARDSHSWGDVECLIPLPPSRQRAGNHHCGQSLSLSKNIPCPRCSLPLTSQVLLSSKPGGLLVLPCGHTLHTVCARSLNKSCPLGCPQVCLASCSGGLEDD
ncbi:Hermansky-Pudlak syndrome 5 protein homolog [Ischnura elegans]|uniref:Hermansky-Pudlak syndrome 5 protein homolog n=1 Tax=Ischnura elegans TaxID=197161 RepID=UPI001ED89EBD|nr:Hermansky-Pudlak syndrome 5 protein homolog [Ischnura elegans]